MKKSNFLIFPLVLLLIVYINEADAGYALDFNANNATRVLIPDSETLDINGEHITMEAWINLPNPAADVENTIINKENSYEMHVRNGVFQEFQVKLKVACDLHKK